MSIIAVSKAALSGNAHLTGKLGLNSRINLAKCYIWSMDFYSAETWTGPYGNYIRNTWRVLKSAAGEEYKIIWVDRVRNELYHKQSRRRGTCNTK